MIRKIEEGLTACQKRNRKALGAEAGKENRRNDSATG